MNNCSGKDRWREELLDHAAGSPAGAALTEHLLSCEACCETLAKWKTRMTEIDAGVSHLAASDPPQHAISRLMAEVRSLPPRGWLHWKPLTATFSGVALSIAAFVFVQRAQMERKETQQALLAASAIASWRAPTNELLQFPGDRWLKTPPQVGGYFYPLGTSVDDKERKTP